MTPVTKSTGALFRIAPFDLAEMGEWVLRDKDCAFAFPFDTGINFDTPAVGR